MRESLHFQLARELIFANADHRTWLFSPYSSLEPFNESSVEHSLPFTNSAAVLAFVFMALCSNGLIVEL